MSLDVTVSPLTVVPVVAGADVGLQAHNDFQELIYKNDLENCFFNTDEFAATFRYYHSSLKRWETYPQIEDNPHASADIAGEADLNTFRPQVQVPEHLLKHKVLKKDRYIVNGKKYRVEDYISDGVGVLTIYGSVR